MEVHLGYCFASQHAATIGTSPTLAGLGLSILAGAWSGIFGIVAHHAVISNPENGGSNSSIRNALRGVRWSFCLSFWNRDRVQRPAPAPRLSRVILTGRVWHRTARFWFQIPGGPVQSKSSRIGKIERRHRMRSRADTREPFTSGVFEQDGCSFLRLSNRRL
jgi:hypothetical protein